MYEENLYTYLHQCTYVGTCIYPEFVGKFKWFSIKIGSISYGLPCHVDSVLCIDTTAQTVTIIPLSDSSQVIRIDPKHHYDNIVTIHGDLSEGGHKWYGGASVNNDQIIVGVPCNANTVLRIDPAYPEPKISLNGNETIVQSGCHQLKLLN